MAAALRKKGGRYFCFSFYFDTIMANSPTFLYFFLKKRGIILFFFLSLHGGLCVAYHQANHLNLLSIYELS